MRNYLIATSALVFIITANIAHQGVMKGWEVQIFNTIFDWPHWLKPAMLAITMVGSSWFVAIVATYLLYKKRLSLALQVIIVGLSSYACVEVAKRLIDRPRPFVLLPDIQARELLVNGLGFPSGHTTAVTAIGLLLYRFLPKKYRYLVFIWIGLVGLSRIYLGVHAPLDVIGGFALGIFISQVFITFRPLLSRWSRHLK